jgi:hypothetical protein
VYVRALHKNEADIVSHFSRREVQNIGSTSGCGCDFPHATLTRGESVHYEYVVPDDPEWQATERFNRQALVRLLGESGEHVVEVYGIWLSDCELSSPENFREKIALERILEPTFRFKERGFYLVTCGQSSV